MRRRHLRFVALLGFLSLCAIIACLLSGCGANARSGSTLVVIDAGHGGRDPGAVCNGVHEADINLAITDHLTPLIEADPRLDIKRTRTLDISVTLADRIAVANDADAALYLSVQSNASADHPEAAGVETLVSDAISEGDRSWQFAEILQDAVCNATGARDRGVRSQDLYLHRAKMPAALVEVGFLTNDGERARLLNPDYQQTIAQAIYDGIVTYLEYADPAFAER
jgi:N-acetylmuramoyl-L-alanine amidase